MEYLKKVLMHMLFKDVLGWLIKKNVFLPVLDNELRQRKMKMPSNDKLVDVDEDDREDDDDVILKPMFKVSKIDWNLSPTVKLDFPWSFIDAPKFDVNLVVVHSCDDAKSRVMSCSYESWIMAMIDPATLSHGRGAKTTELGIMALSLELDDTCSDVELYKMLCKKFENVKKRMCRPDAIAISDDEQDLIEKLSKKWLEMICEWSMKNYNILMKCIYPNGCCIVDRFLRSKTNLDNLLVTYDLESPLDKIRRKV